MAIWGGKVVSLIRRPPLYSPETFLILPLIFLLLNPKAQCGWMD
jgi:hypothetical protein